ncbi:hypothetical protein ACFXI8_27135 [Streptomyces niveus]|uniref:hypothetical protein n=1 Tax=Streptomyces niveus TaxID=193462 RepID=UPI00368D1428
MFVHRLRQPDDLVHQLLAAMEAAHIYDVRRELHEFAYFSFESAVPAEHQGELITMGSLSHIRFIETEEQERARLAQAPEGSTNHSLSTLPVTIKEWPKDLLVELPWKSPRTDRAYHVVVVPIEFRKDTLPEGVEEEPLPRKLHSGSWTCAVVFSDHPSYRPGCFRIIVPAAELARSRRIDLANALTQS